MPTVTETPTTISICKNCKEGYHYPGGNWEWTVKQLLLARIQTVSRNQGACTRVDLSPLHLSHRGASGEELDAHTNPIC